MLNEAHYSLIFRSQTLLFQPVDVFHRTIRRRASNGLCVYGKNTGRCSGLLSCVAAQAEASDSLGRARENTSDDPNESDTLLQGGNGWV